MLPAIRQFLSGQSRDTGTRGDYDALPLSELRDGQSTLASPVLGSRRAHTSSLTPRRAGLTVLSTLLALATVVFIFSLSYEEEGEYEIPAADAPDHLVEIAGNGAFYRDAFPVRSMLKYWSIAENEVQARGLDTCSGQLSRDLIDAYIRSTVDYCHPSVSQSPRDRHPTDRLQAHAYRLVKKTMGHQ
jgi:hypothetical protein